MEDYQNSDEDCSYSDQGSLNDCACEEEPSSELVPGTAKGPSIKVITKETLPIAQDEDLSTIMEFLSVTKHQARILLISHRWDKVNLSAEFVEKGKTLLLAEAGVSEEHSGLGLGSLFATSIMCKFCFAVVPGDEASRMDCGHCFCNSCWTDHFMFVINEGHSKHIRCMEYGCKYYCNEDIVSTLLGKRSCDMAEKFERCLLESYIEDNKRAKWCPSNPPCGNAICVEDGDGLIYDVECSCGFQFCFSCMSKPHSPCSCLMKERWAEKCANWIKHNTQPCPNCYRSVLKSDGCDMISCMCGLTFSWLGGGNDYKEQEEKAEEEEQESRFALYHDRYKAHMMNCSRLTESVGKKASFLGDNSWVHDGLSTLVRSWRVLSYSYPFAFYMFKDEMSDEEMIRKRNVFEDYQRQLEKNIERLSEILEKPFESYKVPHIRTEVVNLSAVIDMFCEHVYEFIQEDLGCHPNGTLRIAPYKLLKP